MNKKRGTREEELFVRRRYDIIFYIGAIISLAIILSTVLPRI